MTRPRWAAVLCVGILVASVGAIWLALNLGGTFAASDHEVPGAFTVDIDEGSHIVFEQVSGGARVGIVNFNTSRAPRVTGVSVTGPQGLEVTAEPPTSNQTLTINDRQYVGVAQFTAATPGEYVVTVDSSDPTIVRVGRDVFDTLWQLLGGLALALGGGALTILAIIMLFTKRTGRGSGAPHVPPQDALRVPAAPSPPPPPR